MILLAIILVWVSIVTHLVQERSQDALNAYQDSGNLARGFGENINRIIEGFDRNLKLLRAAHALNPQDFDLAKIAPADRVLDDLTLQIAITDKAGIMTMGNLPVQGRVDLSDREHIRVHFGWPDDNLFISKPVLGRVSQRWSIQFTRKLFDAAGAFNGVLVMSLDATYLARFYESLSIGSGTILLVGLGDGVVRSHAPSVDAAVGAVLPLGTMERLRGGPPSGIYRAVSSIDGVERFYSYRRLDKYGLAVVVGLSVDETLANFAHDVVVLITVGVVLTVFIVLLGAMLIRQQRRLAGSEARLSVTFENMDQGLVMFDAAGNALVMNRRAIELLDLPPEFARPGIKVQDVLDWQIACGDFGPAGGSYENLRKSFAAGELGPQVYERVRPDGRVLEVRTQRMADGGSVRTYTDISDRRSAERASRTALDRLYTILSMMHAGILVIDANNRIEYANIEFCTLFDLPQEPGDLSGIAPGKTLGLVGSAFGDPPAATSRIIAIMQQNEPVLQEQINLRNGRILLRDFIPIKIGERVFGSVWLHVDVTDQKEIESQLRESEALKSAILASSLDAMISIDRDSAIVEFNPAAERIFGHSLEDAIGRKIDDLIIPHHWRQAHHDGMARYLATGEGPVLNTRIELDALHADGRVFPVEAAIIATPLVDREVFTAYMRDISERRAYEIDLKSARDAAETASKAKSEFLSTISHEIRTPLNGIVGMAGLLLDSHLDASQLRFTETLRDAAQDLQRIIDEILDFSKLEAGRLDFEHLPFSVEQVIASVVDLMGVKAAEKHLALAVRTGTDIPEPLMGDPGRLRQVLMNLVSNGLKFTEAGSVTIATQLRGTKDQRAHLEFTVTDTGIGIPDAAQKKLFRQFSQADSSISRRFGGTGLGLAICSRLVAQMGGSIDIVSAEGHGTTVRFDIYLGIATQDDVTPIPAATPAVIRLPTRKLRILLAEDNVTNRLVAVTRLEMIGHRVNSVANGLEAIDAVRSVPYDLVLMDVMMPDMDGIEATRAIRALSGPVAEVPIVALTANVFSDHRRACLAAGMDEFLAKPLIVDDLLAILDQAMAGSLRVRRVDPVAAGASDLETIHDRLAGEIGSEMADLLLETFATEARETIVMLRARVGGQDWNGLHAGAITLRDAAATMGRWDVVELTAAMIGWSADPPPDGRQFSALLQQLEAAIG